MSQACIFALLSVSIYIFSIPKLSIAVDTITPSLSIRDGETNETIVSAAEQFELGFVSPIDSKNRYLGIWYKTFKPQTVVWVANRNNPIADSNGMLKISDNGNLQLVDQTSSVVWSSNVTRISNPIVQLLDTGNLVIREGGNTDTQDFSLTMLSCHWQFCLILTEKPVNTEIGNFGINIQDVKKPS